MRYSALSAAAFAQSIFAARRGNDIKNSGVLSTGNVKEKSMAKKTVQNVLDSNQFKSLVAKRAKVSTLLMILLFLLYYGFVLLIGFNKPFMAQKIGESVTLGIPMAVAVIILAWLLTLAYVVWANAIYDPEVEKLRGQLFD
jgi:uncharacterized membrane protein (DUF485 family)